MKAATLEKDKPIIFQVCSVPPPKRTPPRVSPCFPTCFPLFSSPPPPHPSCLPLTEERQQDALRRMGSAEQQQQRQGERSNAVCFLFLEEEQCLGDAGKVKGGG